MSEHGFNRNRLRFVFQRAIDPEILKHCLEDTRKQLIVAGVKAANLPVGFGKSIDFLVQLPTKGLNVVRKWFDKKNVVTAKISPDEAINLFLRVESGMQSAEEDQFVDWSRALFAEFVRANCLQSVEEFLKTDISENNREEAAVIEKLTLGPSDATELRDLFDAAGALDPSRSGFLKVLVGGVLSSVNGDKGLAEACKQRLMEFPVSMAREYSSILELVPKVEPRGSIASADASPARPVALDDVDLGEAGDLPVLGFCKNVIDKGVFFVHIEGIFHGEGLVSLTDEEAKRIFKESGDAICYPSEIGGRVIEKGEFGVWRVEHRNTGKPTQFAVREYLRPVYEVVCVPHTSSDVDQVREWLKAWGSGPVHAPALFELKDGLIVKVPGSGVDLRTFDFERPLDAYEALATIQWRGRRVYPSSLPAPDLQLDFAPIGTAVRRVFRLYGEAAGLPQLSKNHLRALADFVEKEGQGGEVRRLVTRVSSGLHRVSEVGELLETVTRAVMELPAVQEEVERGKKDAVEAFMKTKGDLASEINGLEGVRRGLVEGIDRLKKDTKSQGVLLSKEIRKVFEAAVRDGTKTLAEAAFYRAFFERESVAGGIEKESPKVQQPAAVTTQSLPFRCFTPSETELTQAIAELGIRKPTARAWAAGIQAALASGLAVAFKGAYASVIAEQVARAVSKDRVLGITVPAGIVDSTSFERIAESFGNFDVGLIKHANLSAMEAYLGPLWDRVSFRTMQDGLKGPPHIVLSLLDGPIALPVPAQIRLCMLEIDADHEIDAPADGKIINEESIAEIRDTAAKIGGSAMIFVRVASRVLESINLGSSDERALASNILNEGWLIPSLNFLAIDIGSAKQEGKKPD